MSTHPAPGTSRIYGCPGAGAARPLTRSDISPEVRAEIRTLPRLEPRRNLRLALLLPLWGLGASAVLAHSSLLLQVAGTVAIALVLMAASVVMHEGIHHLLFHSRPLNRGLAFFCGATVLISSTAYRALHLRHHSFEHTADDPDDIESIARKGIPLVLVYYVLLFAGTYLYFPHVALSALRAARTTGERRRILLEYAAITVALGAAWWMAPAPMVHLWLFPMLVAAQLTNLRSLAEHGLTTGGSPFTATRSVRTTPVVAFFMCNLNLHLEHHLFPAVPWYNLPRVHALLQPAYRAAGSSVYDGYARFLLDFLRTTWSGVVPNVRLLPAHLRDEACG